MRCDCCNKALSGYESTLRHAISGEYLNTCLKCLDGLGIPIMGREEETEQDEFEEDGDVLLESTELDIERSFYDSDEV